MTKNTRLVGSNSASWVSKMNKISLCCFVIYSRGRRVVMVLAQILAMFVASTVGSVHLGCNSSTFPYKLVNQQFFGMNGVGVVATASECRAACCAAGALHCNTWLYGAETMVHGSNCYISKQQGIPTPSSQWSGECLGCTSPHARVPPPGPPDLPQHYHTVPLGTHSPAEYVDLASDSAWAASVDGAAERSIRVPAGGYNSDLQEPPFIDGVHDVKDNVTYTRRLEIPTAWRAGPSEVCLFNTQMPLFPSETPVG